MQIQYQCTRPDFLEAMACQRKGFLFYGYWIIGFFFVFTGLVTIATVGWSKASSMFVIAAASLAWPIVIRPLSIRRQFKTTTSFTLPQTLVCGEDGISSTSSTGRTENNWSAYTQL
jgi:hypothetical protein